MTDSRKLTDTELEQVAGGTGDDFFINDYIKEVTVTPSIVEYVYKIKQLSELFITTTKYVGSQVTGLQSITPNCMIFRGSNYIKLSGKPDWVPEEE